MRIAIDALGGDNAPGEIVSGVLSAAQNLKNDQLILVGDPATLERHLGPGVPKNVSVREATGLIGMDEDPATALRARPEVSIGVCARLVRGGEADALFSAGNTGATVAAALLGIGRLKNCRRPGIATVLPFPSPVLLIDAGATTRCRPQDLLNFAILGGVFSEKYFRLERRARVGLINVGEEPGKGNDLAKETQTLLQDAEALNFVGNVEGRDIGRGIADVLVADGFTGNIVLKTAEGVAAEIFGMIRTAATSNLATKLAAGVLRPKLREVRDQVDPEHHGGSFLLGVRSPVVIGHGNFGARGVENTLYVISRTGPGLSDTLEEALSKSREKQA